jgi:hypothetical protein
MDVNYIYRLMQYIISKNQQGFLSPSNFNDVINQAQTSYLSYLLGNFQQYKPNHPQANVEFGQNGVIRQRLTPFIKQSTLTITSGVAIYPIDFEQVDSMLTTAFKPIREVQQHYLASNYNSVIDPIATNPIYLLIENGFQFYPTTQTIAKLSYVSTPHPISWAYQLDINGRQLYTTGIQGVNIIAGGSGYSSGTVTFSAPPTGVTATGTVTIVGGVVTAIVMTNYGSGYNNTSPTVTFVGVGGTGALLGNPIVSYDSLWYEVDSLEIIGRALRMVGVSLQSNVISNFATELKNNGQ